MSVPVEKKSIKVEIVLHEQNVFRFKWTLNCSKRILTSYLLNDCGRKNSLA